METLRCRQKQDEVTSGVLIVAPSGQKGFFYFDRVKPTRFLENYSGILGKATSAVNLNLLNLSQKYP